MSKVSIAWLIFAVVALGVTAYLWSAQVNANRYTLTTVTSTRRDNWSNSYTYRLDKRTGELVVSVNGSPLKTLEKSTDLATAD